jgi:heat shock protein HtpX
MATFYDRIAENRRNSVLLVVLVVLLLGALGLTIGWAVTGDPRAAIPSTILAIVVGLVASLVSYYLGDSIVLTVSGAKEVTEQSAPQLMNVVREIAIASNVPMPKVYIIEDTAPNAFATGRDPKHASVAITSGLLQKLDREELQGVMAHELSHVRNYDIRFSLLVGVLVGSIALLADFFLRFTFWGGGRRGGDRDRDSGGGAQIIVFVIAILLAILAPIAARLVQLAVSRQREYLADVSAVELTRNPVGLEQALAKIAADTEVLEVANRATQHLYFENPIKKFEARSSGLFDTHPPVLDRINRLRGLAGEAPAASIDDILGPVPGPLRGARLERQ